ncbi:MAG: hypothetical protein JXB49_30670 [Bacteroidales bacterium]|nr:hypothetical protein [Bacteroidales bacterium]
MDLWFSRDLYKLREPILYNFYLGKDIFRFTLIRAFDPTISIRIEIYNKTANIYTRKLERLYGYVMIKRIDKNNIDTIYPNNNISLSINSEKEISILEIERIKNFIDSINLYNSYPVDGLVSEDGSEWIFESHTREGYFFMNRYSPDETDVIYTLGEIFINLSDLQEKNIY